MPELPVPAFEPLPALVPPAEPEEELLTVTVTAPPPMPAGFSSPSYDSTTLAENVQLPSCVAVNENDLLFDCPATSPTVYGLSEVPPKIPELLDKAPCTPYPLDTDIVIVTVSPTFTLVLDADTETFPAA